MKGEGKTGREIADYFGVSPAYICKRLKVLRPVEAPESFNVLTDKQKKFVLAKVEGETNVEAAMAAFDVTSRDSAKALGHNLMRDPDIGKAIQDIMAEEGLTRRHVVRRLKDLVDHPDGHIAAKGIDMSAKMMDVYPREEKPAPQVFIKGDKLKLIFETLVEVGGKEEAKKLFAHLTEIPEAND